MRSTGKYRQSNLHCYVINNSAYIQEIARLSYGAFHRKGGTRDWYGLTDLQREKVKWRMNKIKDLATEVLDLIEEEERYEEQRAEEWANQS